MSSAVPWSGDAPPYGFGPGDAYRALALGAEAVLVGRPYVYGLALDGEELYDFFVDEDGGVAILSVRAAAAAIARAPRPHGPHRRIGVRDQT